MDFASDTSGYGIRERAATIVGSRGPVPLVLWSPADRAPTCLVLVGHGASGHKREDYVVAISRRLVRTIGAACMAIDGPLHGERRSDASLDTTIAFLEFAQAWQSDAELTDSMIADWRGALDAVLGIGEFDQLSIGYWGLSMGTLFGLPLVAAEERIAACVLGLAGATGPTGTRLRADAPRVLIPTLFLQQIDDELFARDKVTELFDLLGSKDKLLLSGPGRHRDVTKDAFLLSVDFLGDRLGTGAAR